MYEHLTPSPERPVAEELVELRRELAAVHARLDRAKGRPRLPRRLARLLPLGIVALMMALVPLATLAANPFLDLNNGSPHNGNIDLIYNAGITTGCGPTSYCPNGNVTREEMASFLARTAGLGNNAPVVNAKALGGVNAANYVQINSSPTLANLTVDGTIKQSYTNGTTNLATPIAFGYVSAAGALISGTPNVTVTYNAVAERYEIAIAGESFAYNQYQALVTPTLSVVTQPHLVNTSDDGAGKLTVHVYNSFTGTKVQGAFQFAIFKP